MLNQTKMFMYRMVKSKSFYSLMIVHVVYTMLVVYAICKVRKLTNGMMDMNASAFQYMGSGAFAMFTALFAVIATVGDFTSGYIKNVAGRMRSKWHYIGAKTLEVLCYTLMSFIVTLLANLLFAVMFGAKIQWQSDTNLLLLTYLINAFCITMMAVAVGETFRKMGPSVALVVIAGNGLFSLILNGFFYAAFDVSIGKYMPVGAMTKLDSNIMSIIGGGVTCQWVIGVSVIYFAVFLLWSCFDFSRRDVV